MAPSVSIDAPGEGSKSPGSHVRARRRLRGRHLLLVVGTVLLVLYLRDVDLAAFWRSAARFPRTLAVYVVVLNLVPGALKLLRWRLLGSGSYSSGGLVHDYLAVNAGFFLGLVTPGTAGELARGYIAGSRDQASALAAVSLEKTTDLGVLTLLAGIAGIVQLTSGFTSYAVTAVAVGVAAILYGSLLRWDRFLTGPLKAIVARFLPSRYAAARSTYWAYFTLIQQPRSVLMSASVSLALWIVPVVQMHLIYSGLGWGLPLKTVALTFLLPYLIAVLSLIPLGLGAFEWSSGTLVSRFQASSAVTDLNAAPLFFRVMVTLPLIAIGYASHLIVALSERSPKA